MTTQTLERLGNYTRRLEVKAGGKGTYIAQIAGTGTKWGCRREFVKLTRPRGGFALPYYADVEPGVYEAQYFEEGTKTRRYYIVTADRADVVATVTQPDPYDAASLWARIPKVAGKAVEDDKHAPGEPGGWMSETCRCGAEVARYDPIGYPECAEYPQCEEETT